MFSIFAVCLTVSLKVKPILSTPVITAISLQVLIGLLIFPIGGLLSFHFFLIGKGRTTNEHVTGKYRGMNFFTRGCWLNYSHLFCGSLSPQYKTVKIKRKKLKSLNGASSKSVNGKSNNNNESDSTDKSNSESESDNNSKLKDRSESNVSHRGSVSDLNETNRLDTSLNTNNANNQEELLDVVLKNKKTLKNNRRDSISTQSQSSTASSSMLNNPNKDKKASSTNLAANNGSNNNSSQYKTYTKSKS